MAMSKENHPIPIIPTIQLAIEALQMGLIRKDEAGRENDRMPLSLREKAAFVLYHLAPERLKELMLEMSSVKYGRYVLNCVFPKFDNPQDFH